MTFHLTDKLPKCVVFYTMRGEQRIYMTRDDFIARFTADYPNTTKHLAAALYDENADGDAREYNADELGDELIDLEHEARAAAMAMIEGGAFPELQDDDIETIRGFVGEGR